MAKARVRRDVSTAEFLPAQTEIPRPRSSPEDVVRRRDALISMSGLSPQAVPEVNSARKVQPYVTWPAMAGPTWLAVTAALASAGIVGLRAQLIAKSVAAPASATEALLGAHTYLLNSHAASTTSLQIALSSKLMAMYGAITGAVSRSANLVASTREFLLVMAILGSLMMYAVCRKLSLSLVASVTAVLLAGLPQAFVVLRLVAPFGVISSTLLLTSGYLLLLAIEQSSWWWMPAIAGALACALGVAITPAAALLPLGILIAVVSTHLVGSRWSENTRDIAVLACIAAVIGVFVIAVVPGPNALISKMPVVGVVVAGLIVIVRCTDVLRLNPVSVAIAPVTLGLLWPGNEQLSLTIVAIMAIAMGVAAVIDDLLRARRTSHVRAAIPIIAAIAIVAAAAMTSGIRTVPSQPQPEQYSRAASWIQSSLTPHELIQTDSVGLAQLLSNGVPASQLTLGAENSAFVLENAATSSQLPIVARFGSGPTGLAIREVVSSPAQWRQAEQSDVSIRASFGADLSNNPNLALSTQAAGLMRAGMVDSRLLVVISAAASQMKFAIVRFLPGAGDATAIPSRAVVITDITNLPPGSQSGAATAHFVRFLNVQQAPYLPLHINAHGATLIVSYSAPSPIGILH